MILRNFNEGENSYRRLTENLPGIVYRVLIEEDNRMIFLNDMVQAMTGYSPEDLKREKICSIDPLILPEDRLNVINIVKDAIENNVPFEVEYRINNKSGDVKWFSERGRPIRGANGNPSYIDGVIFDITKQKEKEQKLKESKEKYRLITENVNDLIFVADQNMNYEFVNEKAYFKIMGWSKKDMIGKGALSWAHPEDAEKIIEAFKIGFEKGEGRVEARFKGKKGIYHWFEIKSKTFTDHNGKKKALMISRDITQYKQAEQIIVQEREKVNLYLNVVEVILVALDRDGNITLLNKKGHELLGYDEGELIGKNWFEICLPPHDSERVYEYFKKLMAVEMELIKYYENPIWSKTGEKRLISWSTVLFKDETGTMTGLLSSGEDITERKKAELKLEESEEKYRLITENANDIIAVLDDKFRLEYINETPLNKVLGYNSVDYIGKSDLLVIHSEDRKMILNGLIKGSEAGEGISEARLRHKDGHYIWVESRGKTFIDENGEKKILVYFRNITERKKAELKIKKSEEELRKQNVFLNNILKSLTHPFYVINVKDYTVALANTTASSEGLEHGEYCYNLTHGNNKPCEAPCICPLNEVEETKRACVVEHIHYDKEGNEKIYEIYGYPILDKSGNVVQMIEYTLDITPRKIAQQELKESEKRYRLLFESSPTGIGLSDLEGNVLAMNQKMVEMTGFTLDEFKKTNLRNHYVDINDRIRLFSKLKDVGKVYNYELKLKKKDGTIYDASVNIETLHMGEQEVFLTNQEDITERKKTEQKLKKSEENYRDLAHQWRTTFDAMSECVLLLDIESIILRCNKITLNFLGKKDYDEIIGHSCLEIIRGPSTLEDRCPIMRMFESNKKETSIAQIGNKWCEISANPVINDEGDLIGAVQIITDITERIKTEKAFHESEERFRNLIEQSVDGVLLVNENGLIIEWNKGQEQITGMKKEDALGRPIWDIIFHTSPEQNKSLEQHERIKGMIKDALKSGDAPWIGKVRDTNLQRVDNNEIRTIQQLSFLIKNENKTMMGNFSRDITEQKQIQKEIQEKQATLESIFRAAPIGIGMVQNRVLTKVNDLFCKLIGYTQEELLNKSARIVYPSDEEYELVGKEKYEQINKSGIGTVETRFQRKDGKIIDVLLSSVPMVLNDLSAGVTFTALDISERKKVERELKQSEEKYRDLFESSPISLWEENFSELKNYIDTLKNSGIKDFRVYFDKNPGEVKKCVSMIKIVDINKKTLELYKANKKEDFFAGLEKVFTEESLDTFKEQILSLAGGETRFESEAINCTFNGDKLYVFIVCEMVAGFEEDWSKILISIADISERKKAEKKLTESEEKFRTIAERALMGIIILQDNQIKYVNDALLNMFEYTQSEIINWEKEDLTKLIHPEDLSFLREYREHLRSGDKSLKSYYSYKVLTKLGNVKWIDQFSKNIAYKGRPAELVTIMDITEKKEAELELIKLNTLKSELLRRTSHELKTPLVSIKGFSDLLLELYRDKLDDYVIKTIKQIKGGCSRLESLVNDILKTAELESGTVKLKKSKEDLSLLIRICVRELEGLLKLRNHTINLEIPDKLICKFEKEQMHKVISNILNNGIKFTPINGRIDVKTEIKNNFITISIKDNGLGFTKEEKARIFKQFGKIERYGQGYDVISEGSGLGLYISKRIVELHGGEIWVESEGRNKGSTFIISLPLD